MKTSDTLTIKRATSATLKVDEQKIIDDLRDLFAGSQSYLESLFTNDLTLWVNGQIQNDFCPDLYGTLQSARVALSKLQKEFSNCEMAYDRLQEKSNTQAERIVELETLVTAARATHAEHVQRTAHELDEAIQSMYTRGVTINEQSEQIKNLRNEIVQLKAMLWDAHNTNTQEV